MFVVENDYIGVIRSERLTEILQGYDERRLKTERKVDEEIKSYLRHRYDVEKGLQDVLAYGSSTNYYTNNLIEYTETAYAALTAYTVGDRVSYEYTTSSVTYNKIYECIDDSTDNLPTDTDFWSYIVDDKTLYVCESPATGTGITTAFAYTQNAYTYDPSDIYGWDRTSLYFNKSSNDVVYIYESSADRTAGTDYIGTFNYGPIPTQFPATRTVSGGSNADTVLSGTIEIKGFIDDDTDWDVTASNNFTARDNRNQMILGIYIDMIVYKLHFSINPRNIPQIRQVAYDDAKQLLSDINKGNNITVDLPIYEEEPQKGQRFNYGSSNNIDAYHY